MDTKDKFNAVISEIKEAGKVAQAYFTSASNQNTLKSDGSVVTQVDEDIQAKLIEHIRKNFPDDSVIGEEAGDDIKGSSDYSWWIDPIDGTDNFLRRIPFFCVSVARLGKTAEDSFGIVYNPITEQVFASYMDDDVYENDNLHKINSDSLGGRAIISIGRGKEDWMKSADYNIRKAVGHQFGKGAAYGSCALELAYVAANRIDGILIMGLQAWDYAAGLYLVRSGGGEISYYEDSSWKIWTGSIKDLCLSNKKYLFASHSGLHTKALELIDNPEKWSD